MYPVHIDLVQWYVPPMEDRGHGIRLNRTIELPFPPAAKVSVFSREWERLDDPMGYYLKEITWDLDRKCFLAETHISATGIPIAMIPHEIRNLLDCGWTFGSCKDAYRTERRRGRKRSKLPTMQINDWDEDEAATWETMRDKSRPKEFKVILHAIITTMAELHNNCSVAYAMMKTGGYVDIPEGSSQDKLSPFVKKFSAAMREYDALTFDQQWDWCESVQRRYPRLIEVVEAIQ
jgi:hypothetical protein